MAELEREAGQSARSYAILVVAGINLTLVQFFAMREFAALLGSSELVTIMVATGFFLGLSVGYLASDRLSSRAQFLIGAGTLALHASLPFSARWLVGSLAVGDQGAGIPPLLFVLTVCGITPFYAIFLPRMIGQLSTGVEAESGGLVRCYAAEIAGGFAGILVVMLATPARMSLILTLHLTGLVALLLLLTAARPRWLLALAALPVAYAAYWPALDRSSLRYFYERAHEYPSPTVLASEFSPYQRVDLVEAGAPDARSTYLFLNGVLFYGSRSLHQHNLMVSLLPNLLMGRGNSLVVAGGSLDNARYLAPRTGSLRVVELDETVVRLTRRHVQDRRGGFPTNWELIIDDGKHFLGNWQGLPFDVISIDVPVPTHLQTAMLHSERFIALAASRLAPGGLFSISLAGQLARPRPGHQPSERLANRVLAGMLRTFSHVMVVRVGDRDYAWGSQQPLRWDAKQVQARADAFIAELPEGATMFGSPALLLLDREYVEQCARGVRPIGEADMQVVMRISWNKFYHRFYEPE